MNPTAQRIHELTDLLNRYAYEYYTLDAQRMNRFIEERVREHPEQYFWLHKRFKTRPEGSPDFY